jgi:type IV pilus assembly protein PilA
VTIKPQLHRHLHYQRAFTLMELMIVVVIIGLLSIIAIPAYLNSVGKTQASEAFSLLDGLKSSLANALSQDPSSFTCTPAASNVLSGKYVANIRSQWDSPNCILTATFKAENVTSSLSNTTVKLIYDVSTGTFEHSQRLTGGTIPEQFTPKSWQ